VERPNFAKHWRDASIRRLLPDLSREPIAVVERVEKLDEHQAGFGNELTSGHIPSQERMAGSITPRY